MPLWRMLLTAVNLVGLRLGGAAIGLVSQILLARGDTVDLGTRPDGKPYKIGVIDLPSFYMDMDAARRGVEDYKSTTRDVRKILVDFNRAYNPFCEYNEKYICPFAPKENWLDITIQAGEKRFR